MLIQRSNIQVIYYVNIAFLSHETCLLHCITEGGDSRITSSTNKQQRNGYTTSASLSDEIKTQFSPLPLCASIIYKRSIIKDSEKIYSERVTKRELCS